MKQKRPWQFVGRITAASLCAALFLSAAAEAKPARTTRNNAARDEAASVAAEAKAKGVRPYIVETCRLLAGSALANGIPEEFFTRLIWQESRFDATAISPAGAQGIAQFMPGTAAERGLADAFRPQHALRESASYLRELRRTFNGNLGLAAAAYNAGPGQVEGWLAGRRRALPTETLDYVQIVTGYPVEIWRSPPFPQLPAVNTRTGERCIELVKLMLANPTRVFASASHRAWGPWGVQLAGNWSAEGVRSTYERLRRQYREILGDRQPMIIRANKRAAASFVVRVSEKTRESADALCARLQAAGGACAVFKNTPG